MKHLKKYNENKVTRFPQYSRGEIILFGVDSDLKYETVGDLVKRLGYKCIGNMYDTGFVIEVPKGEEEKAGQEIVDRYPSIFTGYERIDKNLDYVYNECDSIIYDVEMLRDSLGSINDFGRVFLPKDWNSSIDSIIEKLNNIKH